MNKVLTAVIALLLAGCAAPEAASAPPSAHGWSVDKVLNWGNFTDGCDSDACGPAVTGLATIPPQATSTDVVVQVTLEGKTARTGWAEFDVALDPATVSDPADDVYLRPGSYRVALPTRSSTTLRWVKHNVPASEAGYTATLGLTSAGLSHFRKAVVHITVTP
jgi:hypothetical protein